MSLLGWCQWLEQTSLATAISESVWLFPILEGSHILALPISVGMILMFDLRLLGLAFQGGSASRMMRDVLRWSKFGFAVMFATGVLLFMTQASKAYESVFFRTKLVFLLMLGINAAVFQILFFPKMDQWDGGRGTPLGARVCGGLSLLVWIGVIICGRTMAYHF
jgi:hypothetical protein